MEPLVLKQLQYYIQTGKSNSKLAGLASYLIGRDVQSGTVHDQVHVEDAFASLEIFQGINISLSLCSCADKQAPATISTTAAVSTSISINIWRAARQQSVPAEEECIWLSSYQ